ncbi:DUF523 domain-containing protein [Tatumella citrea]|uniref:Purine-nucleoside phosphorylase n=1 Tax=Tatumella citrea TaxID=53336 RepID=A0A1Y0LIP7_TATCI|nr:DUF523 domain-containing protein [Tatumella citrea]ARU93699.1 purine-nucleoside phosphorylase [Tatumella citrea]ARU97737.1 purine-nucleoside phosphorylase [Tatumella citrea]
MKSKILVSACLMGFRVRYNGSDKPAVLDALEQFRREDRLVVCCPEQAAGLPTPRLPAEICGGNGDNVLAESAVILESGGNDVTAIYLHGARLALQVAQQSGCRFALLTDGSPTCGSQTIYRGDFSGKQISGSGVAAALLRRHGIEVFSEQQVPQLVARVIASDNTPDI